MPMLKGSAARRRNWSVPALLVGLPSAALERKQALLRSSGCEVTQAEDVCHAEMYAEAQHFDAAVYDETLGWQEQVSLARIMRIRWPWIRIIRCGSAPEIAEEALFDEHAYSEAQLPACIERVLSR